MSWLPTLIPHLMRAPIIRATWPALILLLGGCRGESGSTVPAGESGGTVVISTPAEPDNLMPPKTTGLVGRQVEDLVFEHLATIGPSLNTVGDRDFVPQLATRWAWAADSLSIAFTLDSTAHWHDGRPVRASDVRFTHQLYRDTLVAAVNASTLTNIDSVTVRDSLTAVVWFRTRAPGQFYDAAAAMFVLPEHVLSRADRAKLAADSAARAPIGSGPFRVVRWVPRQVLELAVDTTAGRRRAALDRVVFTFASDPQTAFTRVMTGEADVYEAVRPDKVADVAASANVRLATLPGMAYQYLGFNFRNAAGTAPHPVLSDVRVRRAITEAIDRRAVVTTIFDTLAVPALGPFVRVVAIADTTAPQLAFSPDSANALLDAAGWTRGTDSLRRKGQTPLAFSIIVPSTSAARMRAAVVIQEQLRRVGITVTVESLDFSAFLDRLNARKYDAIMGGWQMDAAPGSVRETWGSAGAAAGGNNAGNYRNATFDAVLDTALAARDPAAMRAAFARAWRVINADAPAVWLAEPRQALAIHRRIQIAGLRPDAWWIGIPQWRIPVAQRIARDAAPR
jgi:peptide/nickel transport system substrate-binding protein